MKLSTYQISKIKNTIALEGGDRIVLVCLSSDMTLDDSSPDLIYSIYRIDKENNIIWQVYEEGVKKDLYRGDPFVGLFLVDDDVVFAYRFRGSEYDIDPESGEAKYVGYSR